MGSTLWNHDSFINRNKPYVFNTEVIEYDMKEAGFSLIKEYKLLDNKLIDKLDKEKKEYRTIQIGKLQLKDPTLSESLKQSFKYARESFFNENGLEDSDIISIKKDAIFSTKICTAQKVGKYIEFRPKNVYTSYLQLGRTIELYYNSANIDIKGISNDKLKLHEDFMIDFLKRFINKMETEDSVNTINFLRRFIDKYKGRKLDVGYYREFNVNSLFITNSGEEFEEYWEEAKDDLYIGYNYKEIIIPLIQILI